MKTLVNWKILDRKYIEEEALASILKSREEIKAGKVLEGNLVDLVKDFRKGLNNKFKK